MKHSLRWWISSIMTGLFTIITLVIFVQYREAITDEDLFRLMLAGYTGLAAIIFFFVVMLEEKGEEVELLRRYLNTRETIREPAAKVKRVNGSLNILIILAILSLMSCQKELGNPSVNSITDSSVKAAIKRDTLRFSPIDGEAHPFFPNNQIIAGLYIDDDSSAILHMDKLTLRISHNELAHPTHMHVLLDDYINLGEFDLTDATDTVVIDPPGRIPMRAGLNTNKPRHDVWVIFTATGTTGGWIRPDLVSIDLYGGPVANSPLPALGLPANGFTQSF
jgi:hypothetical protein